MSHYAQQYADDNGLSENDFGDSAPILTETPDLLAEAVITEVESADGRVRAYRRWDGKAWQVTDSTPLGKGTLHRTRTYPDAPGMDANVALRRFLVERGQEKRERSND